jgi:cyclic beta-1,2-glucan synthetase
MTRRAINTAAICRVLLFARSFRDRRGTDDCGACKSRPGNTRGHNLYRRPLGAPGKKRRGGFYIGLIVPASLTLTVFAGITLSHLLVFLLLIIPISDIVKNLTDFIILRSIRPKHTPRLELKDGIPPEEKRSVSFPRYCRRRKAASARLGNLEEYYLANRDSGNNLLFGILADLPESDLPNLPCDSDCIASAEEEIEKLNIKYGGDFFCSVAGESITKRTTAIWDGSASAVRFWN